MEYKYRKNPRLRNYDYSSDGTYFITICTKDRQQILWEYPTVGRDDLGTPLPCTKVPLSYKGRIIEKYINTISQNYANLSVDKYVIMPDHIHILLSLRNTGERRAESSRPTYVSQIIGVLKRLANKEIGENIFQTSFYDHIVCSKDEYESICNYIETNPQRLIEPQVSEVQML